MRPPHAKASFDDCDVETKSMLLAFEALREHEENQDIALIAGAKIA